MKIKDGIYLVGSGMAEISNRYDCHVYLIEGEKEGVLIDTGAGLNIDIILSNVKKEGVNLSNIKHAFITHCHGDHAGGASVLKDRLNLCLCTSKQESDLIHRGTDDELGLTQAKFSKQYPQNYIYKHCKIDKIVKDNEVFSFYDFRVRPIIISGHSLASVCYLLEKDGMLDLFSGDTIFLNGMIGLLNCYGSNMEEYRHNLRKLSKFEIDGLFPGHFMWTLKNGSNHINMAIKSLKGVFVPKTLGW